MCFMVLYGSTTCFYTVENHLLEHSATVLGFPLRHLRVAQKSVESLFRGILTGSNDSSQVGLSLALPSVLRGFFNCSMLHLSVCSSQVYLCLSTINFQAPAFFFAAKKNQCTSYFPLQFKTLSIGNLTASCLNRMRSSVDRRDREGHPKSTSQQMWTLRVKILNSESNRPTQPKQTLPCASRPHSA